MRVYDNGYYRDATSAELADLAEHPSEPVPDEPSMSERMLEMEEALALLLSGDTGGASA